MLEQYLLDIATNRIDFTFASYQSTNSLWHDKKIKYLATTSTGRSGRTSICDGRGASILSQTLSAPVGV